MMLLDNAVLCTVDTDHDFDAIKAGERVNDMWLKLAQTIANGIESWVTDSSQPETAIRWATYAEACFWKATGEADTHDVDDVLTSASPDGQWGQP